MKTNFNKLNTKIPKVVSPAMPKLANGFCSCCDACAKKAATLFIVGMFGGAPPASTSRLRSRRSFSPPEGLSFEAVGVLTK